MTSSLTTRPSPKTDFDILVDKDSSMPLHLQIADLISEKVICQRMPGCTPLPSERKFAEQLGVSRGTIRKAYESLVEQNVAEINDKGKGGLIVSKNIQEHYKATTFPAIGLVPPLTLTSYIDKQEYLTLDYMSGIVDTASEMGFSIIFLSLPAENEPAEKIQAWWNQIKGKLSGLLYLGIRNLKQDPVFNILTKDDHIPQVCLTGSFGIPYMASVTADFDIGLVTACEHLRELGHKRVGTLVLDYDNTSEARKYYCYTYQRPTSMLNALKKTGISIDDDLIVNMQSLHTLQNPIDIRQVAEGVGRLLSLPERPTAIMCHNDFVAIKAIELIREHGLRVPEDISVLGYDDSLQAGTCDPPLTTVKNPRRLMGREAVRLVVDSFNNFSIPYGKVIKVPTSLVIRASTAQASY